MSLGPEWFADNDKRDSQRSIENFSIDEAECDLAMYSSSIAPVAIETARWMYKNWTTEKIFQLSKISRLTFLEIIEKEILPHQPENNKNPFQQNQENTISKKKSESLGEWLESDTELQWYKIIKREIIAKYQAR